MLRDVTGVGHVIATVNGTAALHACLEFAGAGTGREVIVPALTFVATANAVAYTGATPHFADCETERLGVDPDKLEHHLRDIGEITPDGLRNRLTGRPIVAVVCMHTFGHPSDTDGLAEVCRRHGLILIEDAAEALGTLDRGPLPPVDSMFEDVLKVMPWNLRRQCEQLKAEGSQPWRK